MRIYSYLLFIFLFLSGNFFCSKLPFDPETNLGTDIINDKDSLLTIFDGKICNDTLAILDSTFSFIDRSGDTISGLNKFSTMAIGTWQNERSFAYLKFNADSIFRWIDTINKYDSITFSSFKFNFTGDVEKSDPVVNACIEIGYCNKKPDNTMFVTDSLNDIVHYTYNSSVSSPHNISLNPDYLFTIDSTVVNDTTSYRYTFRNIHTVVIGMVPNDTIYVKTVNFLYPLVNDTVVMDTLINTTVSPYDTSYKLGFVIFVLDTILNTVTYPKDTSVYDSITAVSSLIQKGQTILYSSVKTSSLGDTTIQWDTVITALDTTTVYDINTHVIHIINGQDTTDVIQYDTVHTVTTIAQDSIFQTSTISPRNSLTLHASNPNQWDYITDTTTNTTSIIKNFCLYVRLDSIKSNSLQFIKDIKLSLTYLCEKDSVKTDTVTKTLHPYYYDYSVFETDSSSLDTLLQSSGAAGRFTVLEVDLEPLWNSMKDSSGIIIYKNIPKALLTLYVDSVISHYSSVNSLYARYTLSETKTRNIEDMPTYTYSPLLSATKKTIDIELNKYLIEMRYTSDPLPSKGYLYLWLYSGNFGGILWGKPANGLPISYIISDSQ